MTEFEETPNSTLLVEGEAEVEIEGRAEVFGCPVERLRIPKGRVVPILILEKSLVRISGVSGNLGNYIRLNGSTIPESWEKLARSDFSSIFIFGDVDSGKSSLATFLVNIMGGSKDVLDFDIGQSDIAHPGAMGYAFTTGGVLHISQLQMEDGYFIGSISPAGRESTCLKAVAKLKRLIKGDRAIFDSTGWVKGRKARDYKLAKLEILEPEIIACFGDVPYYLNDFNTVQVESFVVKKRSREMRCEVREETYRENLNGAFTRIFRIEQGVKLGNTSLFSGEEISLEGIFDSVVYAEKGYDFLNIITSEPQKPSPSVIKSLCDIFEVQEVNITSLEDLRGLVVGLYGKQGKSEEKYLGMGLLESIDFESREITVFTGIGGDISRIDFGEIRLQKRGDEGFKEYFVRIP
jgi:polynucleotide 5'-hydroxyl-kinase GRC3/NOL9